MNNPDTITEIPEYRSITLGNISEDKDIPYLEKDCFKYRTVAPYKIRKLRDDKIEIENSSYSGIIQLENLRIHFSTKVKTNLFYMLSFLKDEKQFYYDPEKIIDIKEGLNFFDILGRMFLNELESVYRHGFYKKYVRKEENKKFLKGKIIINRQRINNIQKKPLFYCAYQDLTYDNLENQIILKAATLLIPLIRFNEITRRDLIRYTFILRENVSLLNITPEDCDDIQYSRLNEYYETLIQFSKLILQYYFIRSVYKGAAYGFNFIVNMNKVYEDFVTEIIEDLVNEDEAFADFVVETQAKFDSLVKEKTIITKPDVILRIKDTDKYPLIIDAKYKKQESHADYYQVIAYALALPGSKACCLIYPEESEIEIPPVLTLNTEPFGLGGHEVKLHAIKINLHLDDELAFSEYINIMKTEIRTKLLNCIRTN